MADAPAPDLHQLAQLQRQIIADLASISDDIEVLKSMSQRQDATLEAILREVRAVHSRNDRVANRVRDLETKGGS
jgi:hypothetical protein